MSTLNCNISKIDDNTNIDIAGDFNKALTEIDSALNSVTNGLKTLPVNVKKFDVVGSASIATSKTSSQCATFAMYGDSVFIIFPDNSTNGGVYNRYSISENAYKGTSSLTTLGHANDACVIGNTLLIAANTTYSNGVSSESNVIYKYSINSTSISYVSTLSTTVQGRLGCLSYDDHREILYAEGNGELYYADDFSGSSIAFTKINGVRFESKYNELVQSLAVNDGNFYLSRTNKSICHGVISEDNSTAKITDYIIIDPVATGGKYYIFENEGGEFYNDEYYCVDTFSTIGGSSVEVGGHLLKMNTDGNYRQLYNSLPTIYMEKNSFLPSNSAVSFINEVNSLTKQVGCVNLQIDNDLTVDARVRFLTPIQLQVNANVTISELYVSAPLTLVISGTLTTTYRVYLTSSISAYYSGTFNYTLMQSNSAAVVAMNKSSSGSPSSITVSGSTKTVPFISIGASSV